MRIAIVGAGVSGLVAAHLLHREHEIVVYEAGSYAGGHTNTIRVDTEHETHHVDTGFIVMNDRNYPNFTRLLDRLGVARQPTHMSFSVKGEDEDFEYCGTPRGLFCQPRNLRERALPADDRGPAALQPRAAPAARTGRARSETARSRWATSSTATASRGLFVERLIVPQASAVWSADPRQMQQLPGALPGRVLRQPRHAGLPRPAAVVDHRGRLGALRRCAHGAVSRAHPPRTRPCARSRATPSTSRCSAGRLGERAERFDQVVIADPLRPGARAAARPQRARARDCSARSPTSATRRCCTPTRRCCRAGARRARPGTSTCCASHEPLSTVTYYMNHLQRLTRRRGLLRDAQPHRGDRPGEDHPHGSTTAHPVFTPAGVAAQTRHCRDQRLWSTRTHYCGAYWGWGFHEDGVRSALRACEPFGVAL